MAKRRSGHPSRILAHFVEILLREGISIAHIQADIPVQMQKGGRKQMKDQRKGTGTKQTNTRYRMHQRTADDGMIDNLGCASEELHSDLSAFRKANHMGAPTVPPLTDQLCNPMRGAFDGKRLDCCTQPMFGQIGNQTMIGVSQCLDLRVPHPATYPSSM